jgi:hypothetical protein
MSGLNSKSKAACLGAVLATVTVIACGSGSPSGDGASSASAYAAAPAMSGSAAPTTPTATATNTDDWGDLSDAGLVGDGGEFCLDVEIDQNVDAAVLYEAIADPNKMMAAIKRGELRGSGKPKPCPHKPPLENGITQGEVWQCAMAGIDAIRFKEAEWKIINTFLQGLPCIREINDGTVTNETAKKCLTAACQASKGVPLIDKVCLAWNALMIIDKCFVLFVKYSASLLIPETLNRLLVGWEKEDCIVGPKGGNDRTQQSCLLCCRDKYTTIEDVQNGKLGTCQKYCSEWYAPMVK